VYEIILHKKSLASMKNCEIILNIYISKSYILYHTYRSRIPICEDIYKALITIDKALITKDLKKNIYQMSRKYL